MKIINKSLYVKCIGVGEGGKFRTQKYLYFVRRVETGYVYCLRVNEFTGSHSLVDVTYYKYYKVTAIGKWYSLYFEEREFLFTQIESIEAWQEIQTYIREKRDKRYSGCRILSIEEVDKNN